MENHMKQCSYYSIIELKPPFKIFVIDCENEKAFLNIKLKAGQLQWYDYQHTPTVMTRTKANEDNNVFV